jgi:hypothetical protein
MMGTPYETDVVAWAREQAELLRSRKLSAIDVLNLAEEIEDVGISQQHQLSRRLAILLAHLLKWQFQSRLRSHSWRNTVQEQRRAVARQLRRSPSLKHFLDDQQWKDEVWADAVDFAEAETGVRCPEGWIWTMDQVLDPGSFPD